MSGTDCFSIRGFFKKQTNTQKTKKETEKGIVSKRLALHLFGCVWGALLGGGGFAEEEPAVKKERESLMRDLGRATFFCYDPAFGSLVRIWVLLKTLPPSPP